jgi:hypothetical protein
LAKLVGKWRWTIVAILGIALASAVTAALWYYVRPYVEMQPDYLVAAESIEITPPPAWIRSSIVAETVRDAGLPPQLSILDKDLAGQLSRAFGLHPWVAKVGEIQTSYPASIRVELTYRRPVAMVEVSEGLLPIDVEGVLLPTLDFTPQDAQNYPRVAGISSRPLKSVGTSWGDPSVAAAGQLAALLHPLSDILPHPTIRLADAPFGNQNPAGTGKQQPAGGTGLSLLIATQAGGIFVWGSAPSAEGPEEKGAEEKIQKLRQFAKAYGSLDHVPAEQRDLR